MINPGKDSNGILGPHTRTDRVIFLATLTKNLWTEPSLLNNSILPTQSDHLLGIEQCQPHENPYFLVRFHFKISVID